MPLAAGLPSGRLAFFFSDVEGSTRLLADLGGRFAPLLSEHQRLVRSTFAAHGGTEISTEGDSFFAVFLSGLDAVAAAADARRGLAAYDWPPGHEFRVRVGIHVGQAIVAGDNYVGIDINRAARIANAANGGQVVLSDEASRSVVGTLPADLRLLDLGRHRLKDIGVERLWQLEIEGVETRTGSLRSIEAHPSNLPIQTSLLVDREDEVVALRRLIGESPLVTVTGAGGIGKSRLAIEAARALLPEYPDGVFYLDLAPIDQLETVVTELAAVIDVRMPPSGDLADSLLEHLRDRRVLLVLETADRHPGIATLVARIMENCPTTRVLVTARSPLHLRAEQELPVQPLAVPAPQSSLESALGSPAVELFVRRAQAVKPTFRLTGANVDSVCGIVRRLDGLPLAVELAAAATRLLSPPAIIARLEKSMPLPGGAAIDTPERQRTLANTIAWSYDLLRPPEQALLQRLSVFAGDFDLHAVAAVAWAKSRTLMNVAVSTPWPGSSIGASCIAWSMRKRIATGCWARFASSRPSSLRRLGTRRRSEPHMPVTCWNWRPDRLSPSTLRARWAPLPSWTEWGMSSGRPSNGQLKRVMSSISACAWRPPSPAVGTFEAVSTRAGRGWNGLSQPTKILRPRSVLRRSIGWASCLTSSATTRVRSSGWTKPWPSSARSEMNAQLAASSTASGSSTGTLVTLAQRSRY